MIRRHVVKEKPTEKARGMVIAGETIRFPRAGEDDRTCPRKIDLATSPIQYHQFLRRQFVAQGFLLCRPNQPVGLHQPVQDNHQPAAFQVATPSAGSRR